MKILLEQKLLLSDKNLEPTGDYFKVDKVTTENLNLDFILLNEFTIQSVNRKTKEEIKIDISKIINSDTLTNILYKIKSGSGTFEIDDFEVIQTALGFTVVKGGTSSQKADIVLDIEHSTLIRKNEGFGIKSYLGSKPTLLNASGNTNFMFEITNLDNSQVPNINSISTRSKLKDRIEAIIANGGVFHYQKAEKDTMNYNLKTVDSILPNIVGYLLMTFYSNRISKLSDIVDYLCDNTSILLELDIDDKAMLINKLKKFLVDILLGFFAGKRWNGLHESNGTIVVKEDGSLVTFHIVDMESLRDYLYENIKLDTPSSSRHKFGTIIQDKTKNYFKLNLQLRF